MSVTLSTSSGKTIFVKVVGKHPAAAPSNRRARRGSAYLGAEESRLASEITSLGDQTLFLREDKAKRVAARQQLLYLLRPAGLQTRSVPAMRALKRKQCADAFRRWAAKSFDNIGLETSLTPLWWLLPGPVLRQCLAWRQPVQVRVALHPRPVQVSPVDVTFAESQPALSLSALETPST